MQTETTAVAPTIEGEATETAMPTPDLSVLTEQPTTAEPGKDPAPPQELTETTPASVGLVVALVVVSIVAAVVVAMWMVSPLLALLLGAGLIVVAVLAGAGWLAWRKFTRRSKTGRDRGGRDGSGRGDRHGKSPHGRGKSDWWPFGGGKTPGGGGKNTAGKTPAGKTPKGGPKTPGDKSGGGWWPFGKSPGGGQTPGAKTPKGSPKTPGDGKTPKGGPKTPGDRSGGGWWPFGRDKSRGDAKTPGVKPPASAKTPGGGGKPAGDGGAKKPGSNDTAGRKAKAAGGTALLGLAALARAVRGKPTADKPADGKTTDGKDDPVAQTAQAAPGGHRPETVIDVDPEDIISSPGRSGSSSTRSTWSTPRSAPRTAPIYDPGSAAGSEWWDRSTPTPLHQTPMSLGGPEMSTSTDIDQDAMRVANRYAGLIAKAETLVERARACRDAAAQYRRDARENQESAENHKQAARTIKDPNVAHGHAVAARDAEAEAAREILAARHYEEQAEAYEAQARSIGF